MTEEKDMKEEELESSMKVIGDLVYQHLLAQGLAPQEELDKAVAENRLVIKNVEFDDKDADDITMTFDAYIKSEDGETKSVCKCSPKCH